MNSQIIHRKNGYWFILNQASINELWSQMIEDLYKLGIINDKEYEDRVKLLHDVNRFPHIAKKVTHGVRKTIEHSMIQYRKGMLTDDQYAIILEDIMDRLQKNLNDTDDNYANYDRAMKGI